MLHHDGHVADQSAEVLRQRVQRRADHLLEPLGFNSDQRAPSDA
jgi:hypothetical protein